MTNHVEIFDLSKGKVVVHYAGSSPIQALKCAHLQLVKRNWNTWDYDKIEVPISISGSTAFIGDLAVSLSSAQRR